jgi:hypothetical protein
VYDWGNARLGDEQIAQLRADSGLVHWDETDPASPPMMRVLQCMKRAQEAYDAKPDRARGFKPFDAAKELSAVVVGLSSAHLHMHDVASARRMPPVIAPLRESAAVVAVLAEVCEQAVARVCGRELDDRTLTVSQQLGRDPSLPDMLRTGLSIIQLHMHVVEDARRGRQRALEIMDQLASLTGDDLFYVMHGRWLAHGFRGEAKLAEPLRRRIDVITVDDVWRRKAFLFVEAQLHALTGDLPNLRRTSEAIGALADRFEGWRPWLSFCRAELHRLRGELAAAQHDLHAALAGAAAGEHRAWVVAAPALAELLLLRGDADGALAQARAVVDDVHRLSLDRSAAVSGERVRALAESRRGDHAAARDSLARAFELAHALGYDGLPLARLYEANAAIALAAGDPGQCTAALERLSGLLADAEAPALFRAYEALREATARMLGAGATLVTVPPIRDAVTLSNDMATQVQARLTELDSRQQRAQHALQLLLDDARASVGHLVLFDLGGPFVAASIGQELPTSALRVVVERYLEAELRDTQTAVLIPADIGADTADSAALTETDAPFAPVLLHDTSGGERVLVGVALLVCDGKPWRAVRRDLVQAIGRCLLQAGDSLPLTAEDG